MRPSLSSMKLCTRPARFLQTSCRRLNAGAADVCCSLRRHRGAGLSPRTEHRSASQAAPGSEPGRAGRRNRSRSYMLGIVTTAPPAQTHGRLRQGRWSQPHDKAGDKTHVASYGELSVEVHVRRAAARRLPYRRAASQRGRLGRPHAWSQMPAPPALPW